RASASEAGPLGSRACPDGWLAEVSLDGGGPWGLAPVPSVQKERSPCGNELGARAPGGGFVYENGKGSPHRRPDAGTLPDSAGHLRLRLHRPDRLRLP